MQKALGGSLAATDEAPHPEIEESVRPLPSDLLLIDNTKLGAFKRSPRLFYYEHIRCWKPEGGVRYPLVRGSGWSLAMDAIWSALCQTPDGKPSPTHDMPVEDIAQLGWDTFRNHWIDETEEDPEDYGAEMQRSLYSNSPHIIREMLLNYAAQRADWLNERRLLGVEIPLVIKMPMASRTVGAKVLYACRLDKLIAEGNDHIYWVDHKTTGLTQRGGGFKQSWLDGWNPNPQADGYTFAGRQIYGKRFSGGLIDAALCHGSNHETFTLLPVDSQFAMLQQWQNAAEYHLWYLFMELQELSDWEATEKAKRRNVYMPTFPCDGASCVGMYGDCPYRDICRTHANPHALKEPPIDYIVDEWAPFKGLSLDGSDEQAVVDHRLFGGGDLARAEHFMNTGVDDADQDA